MIFTVISIVLYIVILKYDLVLVLAVATIKRNRHLSPFMESGAGAQPSD